MSDFEKELEQLLNRHSMENGSNTPDFILARFMMRCLHAWNDAVCRRDDWFGRAPKILDPQPLPPPETP